MKLPRAPLWAPYVDTFVRKGKDKIYIKYKGGEVECAARDLFSIMIYGDACPIGPDVLELLAANKVPLIIHRRNMKNTVWVTGSTRADGADMLTKQVKTREDQRKRKYVARQLLQQKFNDMSWLLPNVAPRLHKKMSLKEMRNVEAVRSKMYWRQYFKKLNKTSYNRRENNAVSAALDAGSKFVSSAILRWIHYHHLSPYHGFLHEMTDYPALIYDLIEPYRSLIDHSIFEVVQNSGEEELLEKGIVLIKEKMHAQIYCPQTKQIASRQELLHGVVLALRSYLLGETRRFSVPREGVMNGGRPQKNPWKLYGRHAGITRVYLNKAPSAH